MARVGELVGHQGRVLHMVGTWSIYMYDCYTVGIIDVDRSATPLALNPGFTRPDFIQGCEVKIWASKAKVRGYHTIGCLSLAS